MKTTVACLLLALMPAAVSVASESNGSPAFGGPEAVENVLSEQPLLDWGTKLQPDLGYAGLIAPPFSNEKFRVTNLY